jgi:hypothetical protein
MSLRLTLRVAGGFESRQVEGERFQVLPEDPLQISASPLQALVSRIELDQLGMDAFEIGAVLGPAIDQLAEDLVSKLPQYPGPGVARAAASGACPRE